MISVLFWPIHPPPALLSPSKISRRAQWVVLTLYKLESPGHQEIFFLSFQEDSDVQQNLGNTAIYAFCLGFLSFGLKRQTCSLLFIVKEKKNASPFAVNSDTQLLDLPSFLRRITSPCSVLLCRTRLQPLIPSQLLSYLPLYSLSSLKLLQINCYPSEFSALIQVPIFSYRWYLPASLSMKKSSFF